MEMGELIIVNWMTITISPHCGLLQPRSNAVEMNMNSEVIQLAHLMKMSFPTDWRSYNLSDGFERPTHLLPSKEQILTVKWREIEVKEGEKRDARGELD